MICGWKRLLGRLKFLSLWAHILLIRIFDQELVFAFNKDVFIFMIISELTIMYQSLLKQSKIKDI